MADRGPDGPRLEVALREEGFSLVSCDVVALPERVARIEPIAVLLDIEQPHAEVALRRIQEGGTSRGDHPFIVAIGSARHFAETGLAAGPRLCSFPRPVDVSEVVAAINDAAASGSVRTEVPSSLGSLPLAADSDALLVSDFPALAGLPEVESILPELERRASPQQAGELSPEIEALLESAARRVQDLPEGEIEPRSSRAGARVPPEMMVRVEELLLGEEDSPQTRGGFTRLALDAPAAREPEPAAESQSELEDELVDREAITSSQVPAPPELPPRPDGRGERISASEAPRTVVGETTSIGGHKTEVGHAAGPASRTPTSRPPAIASMPFAAPSAPMSAAALTDRMQGPAGTERPPASELLAQPEPSVPYPPSPSARPPQPTSFGRRHAAAAPPRAARSFASEFPRTSAGISWPEEALSFPAGGTDPIIALASAVAARATGALVLADASEQIVRRVLLRDGDLVNAASEHPDDGLIGFLVERGDLSPEVARRRLKLPPTGRHAAAALIAQGMLGQDDLWPVLRTHAEWIIGRALQTAPAVARLEREPPERLRAEPNVFGGAAGVEVFIEAVRRVISPEEALSQLGGQGALVEEGERGELLAESALSDEELDAVHGAPGVTLGQLAGHYGRDILPALFALKALGILEVRRASGSERVEAMPPSFDPLDADAIRLRVKARLALVHEADYFSLLGLTPNATPYELKRAFLDLRRSFEPSRLLTAATADLAPDLELIVEVLEEAYDILRDPRRRARYRRAIEASQP